MPQPTVEQLRVEENFWRIWNSPNCIGDSADDDVEINNSVDDMVSDDIDDNNVNDLDDAVIEEVSPLRLDEENSETYSGILSPPQFNYSPPTIRDLTSNYTLLENSNVGLKINPDGDQPIDFFNLLLTNDFFEFIVRETNNYAADLYMNRSSQGRRKGSATGASAQGPAPIWGPAEKNTKKTNHY
ncbi:hypothetical protein QTP88_013990 [Uroleucon formosanum]